MRAWKEDLYWGVVVLLGAAAQSAKGAPAPDKDAALAGQHHGVRASARRLHSEEVAISTQLISHASTLHLEAAWSACIHKMLAHAENPSSRIFLRTQSPISNSAKAQWETFMP